MSEEVEIMKEAMRSMITGTRALSTWMLEGLPQTAETDGQRALEAKHGTPYQFGEACLNALDMISPGEAKAAIDRYMLEWESA